jgi:hypothetical protein
LTEDERRRILALLRVDPLSRRSGHDQLKDVAPKATVSRLRRHLDHLAWLDGIGSATAAWLKGIPAAKIDHFADLVVVAELMGRSRLDTGVDLQRNRNAR